MHRFGAKKPAPEGAGFQASDDFYALFLPPAAGRADELVFEGIPALQRGILWSSEIVDEHQILHRVRRTILTGEWVKAIIGLGLKRIAIFHGSAAAGVGGEGIEQPFAELVGQSASALGKSDWGS